MGSHSLTTTYRTVPEDFRARLVGKDYDLPKWGPVDPNSLKGYRVALVTTHGAELPEFDVPQTYLSERGASVDVLTQLFDWQPEAPGAVVLVQWWAVNVYAHADKRISDAQVIDYDAVIAIGGAWNPIMLRTDGLMKNFIRQAHERRLLIASICHGPQLLISSQAFPPGTKATGVSDIRIDIVNAGFSLLVGPDSLDEYDKRHPVVYDEHQRLITSPNPDALNEFCEEIALRLQ